MYNKNIGRSLCRRRPVSMPASAGLYAGVGRSLCRRMGPMGPRGLGPNPFSTVLQNSFFVVWILGVQKIKYVISHENRCIFTILANVDLNLRLGNCKIAI